MRVSVISQKGGVGKSTIALGLAAGFAREGRRCLLIDADPQETATAWERHRASVGLPPVPNLTIAQRPTPDIHTLFQSGGGKGDFDDAVIDGPPRADEALARSVLAAADRVLVPVKPSLADLWAARKTFALIRQAQASGLPLKAAIVLSMVKPGTNLGREFAELVKGEGIPVLPAATHDRTAYAAALSSCQTIFEFEPPSGRAAQEMTSLLEAVRAM